jgi:hypothetical protein
MAKTTRASVTLGNAPKPSAAQKPSAEAPAPVAVEKDFVVKEIQTSADDAVKLAYGSMTLPPAQFISLFTKVGEEYLHFVAKRMQAQAARFSTLAKCTNPEDLAKAEMTFFGKAAQDYAEEFDRLAETTHDAAKTAKAEAGKAG